MSWIYDNLIQRGVDYNTTTQDGYIPVNNLYVQLGDSYGATDVYVANSAQVPVTQIRSDGYVGIHGDLTVNGYGNTNTGYITLNDTTAPVSIFLLNANPNGVVTGTKASIGMNYNDGYLYSNFNGATQWSRYATLADISAASETLQAAYLASTPATITTNSTNGNVTIAGTQALAVTATGGITLSTGFSQVATGVGNPFNVNVTNAAFTIDGYNVTSHVLTHGADLIVGTTGSSGNLSLQSANTTYLTGTKGIVVDGYGFGVVPAVSNVDALGSSTAGFSNLYVENVGGTAVVGLLGAGGNTTPNTTSGAAAVGTNKLNFTNFGPSMTQNTVQAALEAIDGYFTTIKNATRTTTITFPLGGAILNGNAVANNLSETPSIDMVKNQLGIGGVGRMLYTMAVPTDWDGVSSFTVNVLWSPSSTNGGVVQWLLEYKILNLTNLVTTAQTTVTYNQTASGTANALTSTSTNLVIPGGSVATSNAMIVFNIIRNSTAGADTFTGNAQVSLVTVSYNGKDI